MWSLQQKDAYVVALPAAYGQARLLARGFGRRRAPRESLSPLDLTVAGVGLAQEPDYEASMDLPVVCVLS